ncbi:MAG: hypothetical protein GIW99_11055 [Candidatus Eremiobacteraeota bacterium]|nr:hypothetical protein [Candidatus Eremiobacteraeota bacterium]
MQGSDFHVLLAPTAQPRLIDVNAPADSQTFGGVCAGSSHNVGAIDINEYDNIVTHLINRYATPSQLPIVASYNIVETEGGGGWVIGYHSAYARSNGTQTYTIGAYTDRGIFQTLAISDIHAWSHELGEWMDDPFIDKHSGVRPHRSGSHLPERP